MYTYAKDSQLEEFKARFRDYKPKVIGRIVEDTEKMDTESKNACVNYLLQPLYPDARCKRVKLIERDAGCADPQGSISSRDMAVAKSESARHVRHPSINLSQRSLEAGVLHCRLWREGWLPWKGLQATLPAEIL